VYFPNTGTQQRASCLQQ